MDPILLDVKQTSAAVAIDESTCLRWVRDGILPQPMMISGLPRWHRETLERWALGSCPACDPPSPQVMLQIRKGNLEDSFRTNPEVMENEE